MSFFPIRALWHPLLLQCLCKGSIVTIKKERNEKVYCIFEIPTVDFHRAVDFYETVFGVQLPVLNVKRRRWRVSRKKVKRSALFFMLPIIFLRKRSDYLF